MKEMLGGLADSQIEFYKSVCTTSHIYLSLFLITLVGNGGMGPDYSSYFKDKSGCLVRCLLAAFTILHVYNILILGPVFNFSPWHRWSQGVLVFLPILEL